MGQRLVSGPAANSMSDFGPGRKTCATIPDCRRRVGGSVGSRAVPMSARAQEPSVEAGAAEGVVDVFGADSMGQSMPLIASVSARMASDQPSILVVVSSGSRRTGTTSGRCRAASVIECVKLPPRRDRTRPRLHHPSRVRGRLLPSTGLSRPGRDSNHRASMRPGALQKCLPDGGCLHGDHRQ